MPDTRDDNWQIHLKNAKDLTDKIRRPNQQNYNDNLVLIAREFFASVKHTIDELPRGSANWREYRQGKDWKLLLQLYDCMYCRVTDAYTRTVTKYPRPRCKISRCNLLMDHLENIGRDLCRAPNHYEPIDSNVI